MIIPFQNFIELIQQLGKHDLTTFEDNVFPSGNYLKQRSSHYKPNELDYINRVSQTGSVNPDLVNR